MKVLKSLIQQLAAMDVLTFASNKFLRRLEIALFAFARAKIDLLSFAHERIGTLFRLLDFPIRADFAVGFF